MHLENIADGTVRTPVGAPNLHPRRFVNEWLCIFYETINGENGQFVKLDAVVVEAKLKPVPKYLLMVKLAKHVGFSQADGDMQALEKPRP